MAEAKIEIKFTIGDVKTGKSYAKTLPDNPLIGKKIGDTIQGNFLGLAGYDLKITGGSDRAGFPMIPGIDGTLRKRIILKKGNIGIKNIKKCIRKRKLVVGNTISPYTAQVNTVIMKHGSKSIEEILGVKPKEEVKENVAS